ncbi:MAG: S-methyl-5-thioribose-1-phosphate isomerase [Planctomycetota bacterium]
MTTSTESIQFQDGHLDLLDQTLLPTQLVRMDCQTVEQTHAAIRRLVVRGAPAIGIAAASGVCLAKNADGSRSIAAYRQAIEYLATSRPTAVNLFWALDRMRDRLDGWLGDSGLKDEGNVDASSTDGLHNVLIAEATQIHEEDRQMCRDIGRHGAELLNQTKRVVTHCNAGGLATAMWGTALAPIYHLHEQGTTLEVFADETRPLLQGGRLTAWELSRAGIPVTVMTDSMAGSLMRTSQVDAVIVGADRITRQGDVANKIGTYPLAVLAKHHGIPFYVAAPTNTFDRSLLSGDDIPIEQRDRGEVAAPHGTTWVPDDVPVINPAFDVTPHELVTAIITERGVVKSPNEERLSVLWNAASVSAG